MMHQYNMKWPIGYTDITTVIICVNNMKERIQKILAANGLASRREIEKWIQHGEVHVNGVLATLGDKIDEHDIVLVRGRRIDLRGAKRQKVKCLIYHKPEGVLCTRDDPQGRETIYAHLPKSQSSRWLYVGRLDFNTSGLLLLTNYGELAHRLTHPKQQIEREYAVRILGTLDKDQQQRLLKGVLLEDGPARFASIIDAGGQGVNHWYHVTLHEGRNREIRRLFEAIGLSVSRLIRVRYANICLSRSLRRGQYRYASEEEVQQLMRLVALDDPKSQS